LEVLNSFCVKKIVIVSCGTCAALCQTGGTEGLAVGVKNCYEKDCGWVLIFNRLKELGRLDLSSKLRDARDWSESGHQREVVFR